MNIPTIPPGSKVQPGDVKELRSLEQKFLSRWESYLGTFTFTREQILQWMPESHVRLIEGRKLEWDFVWREFKVCVEVQGGQFMGRRKGNKNKSGHSSIVAQNRDAEKVRLAAAAGWTQLNFTTEDVDKVRGFDELALCLGLIENAPT